MRRAKHILTTTVAVAFGVGAGLSEALSTRTVDPVADAITADFLLDPVLADVPPEPEPAPEPAPEPKPEYRVTRTLVGSASYYANSLAGRKTASGVPYNPREMVAAHKTLPFGSRLRVTNPANGRTVEVRVVDRGPFARGRILDLSRRAAEQLDFIRRGHTKVTIEVLES